MRNEEPTEDGTRNEVPPALLGWPTVAGLNSIFNLLIDCRYARECRKEGVHLMPHAGEERLAAVATSPLRPLSRHGPDRSET